MSTEKYKLADVFSRRLDELMRSRELTQANVAALAGVSQPAVSGWLRGSLPDMEQMIVLARNLEVPLDYFIHDSSSAIAKALTPSALRDAPASCLIDDALADVVAMREQLASLGRKLQKMKGAA